MGTSLSRCCQDRDRTGADAVGYADRPPWPSAIAIDPDTDAYIHDSSPPQFRCAITLQVMTQPVVTHEGFTYDYAAIRKWIRRRGTDPVTGSELAETWRPTGRFTAASYTT